MNRGSTSRDTSASAKRKQSLPATPWGKLPPQMRVLYVTTQQRTGAWLAQAFSSDSACDVTLEEAHGAADGVARLREQVFDAVLVSHEPGELDALSLVDGLRAGGTEEPLLILGQPSEQEMSAMCYEVGADGYICANTATTRTLLWIVARAIERHTLIRENRRLIQGERHRQQLENQEAHRLLTEQRGLVRDSHGPRDAAGEDDGTQVSLAASATIDGRLGGATDAPPLAEPLCMHYREMLRAHVIMGSGNLAGEMAGLAEMLADAGVTAPQTMHLHVQVLEELVHGLGNRSARHVMTRADLLLVEILVQLSERYRLRAAAPAIFAPAARGGAA
jgi:DNA-binding NarL/FixJ family response regulator